jgi:hypothetical protein
MVHRQASPPIAGTVQIAESLLFSPYVNSYATQLSGALLF